MNFDDILATVDGQGNAVFPEAWGQGRALFGGIIAAVLYDHLEKTVSAGRRLRSFSLSFVAPAAPGPVSLRGEVLREGKSVMQAMVTARQGEQVVAVMLASFGAARESAIMVKAPGLEPMKSSDEAMKFPFIQGMMPDFLQHFDMRYAAGMPPYSGSSVPDFAGYMRFAETPKAMTTAALICLVDTWPPSVLPMLKGPAAASSLTWTMELLEEPDNRPADTLWQYAVTTDQCSEGYGQSRAVIADQDGNTVALSRQTITVFA